MLANEEKLIKVNNAGKVEELLWSEILSIQEAYAEKGKGNILLKLKETYSVKRKGKSPEIRHKTLAFAHFNYYPAVLSYIKEKVRAKLSHCASE